jgi:hypothetical protein
MEGSPFRFAIQYAPEFGAVDFASLLQEKESGTANRADGSVQVSL